MTTPEGPSEQRPPEAARAALLIVDMIGTWDFPDGAAMLERAQAIAPCVQRLAASFREAGRPVIYVNDNYGQWRSDFPRLLEAAANAGPMQARLVETLRPAADDYFVLKPKHSAFFATPLELLLHHLGTRRLVLTGVTADQCVMATAMDAKQRECEVVVVSDGVTALDDARTAAALKHFREVLQLATCSAAQIDATLLAQHGR